MYELVNETITSLTFTVRPLFYNEKVFNLNPLQGLNSHRAIRNSGSTPKAK